MHFPLRNKKFPFSANRDLLRFAGFCIGTHSPVFIVRHVLERDVHTVGIRPEKEKGKKKKIRGKEIDSNKEKDIGVEEL